MVDGILKDLLDEENFGGTRIDPKRNKVIIMALNATSFRDILQSDQAIPLRPYIAVLACRPTRNSLSTLKNSLAEIVLRAQTHHPVELVIYIDVEKNNIIMLRINGEGVYNKGTKEECTTGFWIKNTRDLTVDYIVTAGHCIDPDDTTPEHNTFLYTPWETVPSFGKTIGPMVFYNDSVDDFGLIQITNKDLKPTRSIRNTESDIYKELFINDVEPILTYYAHLYGVYIDNKGFVKENLIVTTMDSTKSDSGGPVFHARNLPRVSLNGIHIVGAGPRKLGHLTIILKVEDIFRTDKIELVLGG
ncbi:14691_t:CDS:2 [Cetraspora pellucida]|uniref:14691_t:CDS:1 n=1 Tax=Cetraspora pellucida TaxID=1433469 RepID=A0A9N8WIU9_9GLOM|nr:14691_t:CDS:2 [Cetraspora pellucida]